MGKASKYGRPFVTLKPITLAIFVFKSSQLFLHKYVDRKQQQLFIKRSQAEKCSQGISTVDTRTTFVQNI